MDPARRFRIQHSVSQSQSRAAAGDQYRQSAFSSWVFSLGNLHVVCSTTELHGCMSWECFAGHCNTIWLSEIDYGNLVIVFQAAYALGMLVVGMVVDRLALGSVMRLR